MGQLLHGCATTTETVRRAIQHSQESIRVLAERCQKVRGQDFYGYWPSKREHYFGWQLHLVCDAQGVPVAFDILPARWDELVPVQHLLAGLPEGSQAVADKGYISSKDELLASLLALSFTNVI